MRAELSGEDRAPAPPAPYFECEQCGYGHMFPKRPDRCIHCGGSHFISLTESPRAQGALEQLAFSFRRIIRDLEFAVEIGIERSRHRRRVKLRRHVERARRQIFAALRILASADPTRECVEPKKEADGTAIEGGSRGD